MSYDLEVWSIRQPDLPSCLPQPDAWVCSSGLCSRTGRGWAITVETPVSVDAEDVPTGVTQTIPGVGWFTSMQLSPESHSGAGVALVERTASAVAKVCHGVVVNPQTDEIITARGVKRLGSLGSEPTTTLVEMNWWFDHGPLANRDLSGLIDVLEAVLPEALPRRYGEYEPPSYSFTEQGREHFLQFAATNDVVWYPSRPVADVSLSVPPVIGGSRHGYRAGHISISVDGAALVQPGWNEGVRRAWIAISESIQPFYGDVRRMRGWQRSSGRYWSGTKTQQHPTSGWWWTGLPEGQSMGMVIGDAYPGLWPSFCEAAQIHSGGLCFLWRDDWTRRWDLLEDVPPPDSIRHQPRPAASRRLYPEEWPHSCPFDESVR